MKVNLNLFPDFAIPHYCIASFIPHVPFEIIFFVLDNFFHPIGPKGKYKPKLSASLPMVNALHTTVHTTQYVHNNRPKGGLISEGILTLVPSTTKGAKSLS